jgi:hypothetical protein
MPSHIYLATERAGVHILEVVVLVLVGLEIHKPSHKTELYVLFLIVSKSKDFETDVLF